MATSAADRWSTAATAGYSTSVARSTTRSASRIIELARERKPIDETSAVLDVGAGSGAVALEVALGAPSTKVLATDISESMLDNVEKAGLANVSTLVADVSHLGTALHQQAGHGFSHIFCTFMLQTITTPQQAVEEMTALLRPGREGGVLSIGIWGKPVGPFTIWERACQRIDPSYRLPPPFDDPQAWRTCQELSDGFSRAGLVGIHCEEVIVPFPFASAEAFSDFWFHGLNPAAVKCMSNWPSSDMDKAQQAVLGVAREEFGNGKDVFTCAVLGIASKP